MIRKLILATVVASMALAPVLVSAADETVNVRPDQSLMVCRALKPGETGNSQMAGQSMRCKPVDMQAFMNGPDMANAKTSDDASKAWKAFIRQTVTSPL